MDIKLKEFGEAFSIVYNKLTDKSAIANNPNMVYGMIIDCLPDIKYDHYRRLIKKGFDSKVYSKIYLANNRKEEANRSIYILIDREFMTEKNAKQTIGLFLIALDNSEKNLKEVEKFIGLDEQPKPATNTHSVVDITEEAKKIANEAFTFLEINEWKEADQCADEALKLDPKCSKAYLAKLLSKAKLNDLSKLKLLSTPKFSTKYNFKNACKYATKEELVVLKELENENIYVHAEDIMKKATTSARYLEASRLFKLCLSYKNSSTLYNECNEKANKLKQQEITTTNQNNTYVAPKPEPKSSRNYHYYDGGDIFFTILSILVFIMFFGAEIVLLTLFRDSFETVGVMRWIVWPIIGIVAGIVPILIYRYSKEDYVIPGEKIISIIVLIAYLVWGIIRALYLMGPQYRSLDGGFVAVLGCIGLFLLNIIGPAFTILFCCHDETDSLFDTSEIFYTMLCAIVFLFFIGLEIFLLVVLRDSFNTSWAVRWLWWPGISIVCGIVPAIVYKVCRDEAVLDLDVEDIFNGVIIIVYIVWGIIKALFVLGPQFRATDNVALAIFACFCIFIVNVIGPSLTIFISVYDF